MQLAHFRIAVHDDGKEQEICNTFLRSKKILKLNHQFVADGANSYWSVLVEYLESTGKNNNEKRERIDYRKVLSPEDFSVFDRLRKARKKFAERDGVPVYTVFTNEQLAKIVTEKITTPAELKKIDGVGQATAEKYASILAALKVE